MKITAGTQGNAMLVVLEGGERGELFHLEVGVIGGRFLK